MYIDPSEMEGYPRPRKTLPNFVTIVGIVLGTLVLTTMIMDLIGMGETVTNFTETVGTFLYEKM